MPLAVVAHIVAPAAAQAIDGLDDGTETALGLGLTPGIHTTLLTEGHKGSARQRQGRGPRRDVQTVLQHRQLLLLLGEPAVKFPSRLCGSRNVVHCRAAHHRIRNGLRARRPLELRLPGSQLLLACLEPILPRAWLRATTRVTREKRKLVVGLPRAWLRATTRVTREKIKLVVGRVRGG
jgi:hypothetical protein